jgi:hypothetical protein
VVQIERGVVIAVGIAVALGFALWQLASAVGYTAADLLVQWWDDDEAIGVFGAEFGLGGVDVAYGQVLQAVIGLALAILIAVPAIRHVTRRRMRSSEP